MDFSTVLPDALILSEKLTHESYDLLESAIKSYEGEILIHARKATLAS